ncbi:MAG: PQQ-binding-like beta-propeller repeat protein [Planctomycetaceae bacterium]|nr:PQQ-binding-like beta-propeller repeat protein [Planctomycetaceae bacterium]
MSQVHRSFIAGVLLLFPMICSGQAAEKPASALPQGVEPTDWPWWRGPMRTGEASADQVPPLTWSDTENVAWFADLPGRSHGSPIVVGSQVILSVADNERGVQSLLCFDSDSGKRQWECIVHTGGIFQGGNKKASQASSTPACDGERIFINFLNSDAIWTSAVSRDGKVLWQKKVSDYVVHQGYGSSPAIYENLVIATADNKGGGAIVAFDRATGAEQWRRERPAKPNYPSPIILNIGGKDQLIMTGCDMVTSLDPLTGKQLWEMEGATTECVTSTVTDGTHIYTSGGYPKNHISAVVADGSNRVAWENTVRTYVPSMLIRDGYLYTIQDAGIATCFEAASGKELWKGRLSGTFSASPVMVGNAIYVTNEAGETFVFEATPEQFNQLAKSKLGDEVMATPTFCRGRIYVRVAFLDGDTRRERLYCLAQGVR